VEQQAAMLERNPNVLASAVTRASEDFQARLYKEVATDGDRERMLERLDPNVQEAVAKSVGASMDDFGKLAVRKRAKLLLEKAPTATLAQVVKFAEAKDQCSLFGRANVEMKRTLIATLTPEEKGVVLIGRGPEALYERSNQETMEKTTQQKQ
jgi:Mg/Co/Ni transporter MgtE